MTWIGDRLGALSPAKLAALRQASHFAESLTRHSLCSPFQPDWCQLSRCVTSHAYPSSPSVRVWRQAAKLVLLRPGDVYLFSGGTAHTAPWFADVTDVTDCGCQLRARLAPGPVPFGTWPQQLRVHRDAAPGQRLRMRISTDFQPEANKN